MPRPLRRWPPPGQDAIDGAHGGEHRIEGHEGLDRLATEMLRDIEAETVDFGPNYDGRSEEPAILPARFPNLLVNGSARAVGAVAQAARRLQTGHLYTYALVMLLGVFGLLTSCATLA